MQCTGGGFAFIGFSPCALTSMGRSLMMLSAGLAWFAFTRTNSGEQVVCPVCCNRHVASLALARTEQNPVTVCLFDLTCFTTGKCYVELPIWCQCNSNQFAYKALHQPAAQVTCLCHMMNQTSLECNAVFWLSTETVRHVLQDKKAPETVKDALAQQGINVSISPANSTLLDFSCRGLDKVLRASVHYYNTVDEVVRFVQALQDI